MSERKQKWFSRVFLTGFLTLPLWGILYALMSLSGGWSIWPVRSSHAFLPALMLVVWILAGIVAILLAVGVVQLFLWWRSKAFPFLWKAAGGSCDKTAIRTLDVYCIIVSLSAALYGLDQITVSHPWSIWPVASHHLLLPGLMLCGWIVIGLACLVTFVAAIDG